MITDSELEQARREAAEAYRDASTGLALAQHDMDVARGNLNIQTLATNLAGWHWGKAVNALHGGPPGRGGGTKPGALNRATLIAYSQELGLSTYVDPLGNVSGGVTISMFRRMAAMIRDEEHLRELTAEFGSYGRIIEHLSTGRNADEIRSGAKASVARSYGRYAPPQEWSSYLVQRGLDRKEISAAMRVSLEALGPEESFKLWDHAGRPAV